MEGVYENMSDLTVIYYTSNYLDDKKPTFIKNVKKHLLDSIGNTPLISVSQKHMDFGLNYCLGDIGRSHINIYRQALFGAKEAKTKYIALAEDDIFYTKDHFDFRPPDGHFGYNKHFWSIYTWVKPAMYSYKDRLNLNALICERDLFIEAMEERFNKYPDDSKIDLSIWAEPGRYEGHLGVTKRDSFIYYSKTPFLAFSHDLALGFLGLGKRKKLGILRCTDVDYWGKAEDIIKLYE